MKTLVHSLTARSNFAVIILAFIGLNFWGCSSDSPKSKTAQKTESRVNQKSDSLDKKSADQKFKFGMELDDQGKYPEALKVYLEALDICEKIGDQNFIARIYNAIGVLHKNQGQDKSALEYYLKSLSIREEILKNNPTDKICQTGKAITLNNIGILFNKQNQQEKALQNYLEALTVAEGLDVEKDIALYCNNIGNAHRKLGDYRNAYLYLEKGLKIRKEIGDKIGEAWILVNLGAVQTDERKFSAALKNFEKALAITKQIGDKNLEIDIYTNLARTAAKRSDYARAYEYQQEYSDLKEKLVNEESTRQIAEMQTKYETEKHALKIISLNKDLEITDAQVAKQKLVIAGFALLVVVVSFFVFWFFHTSKKEREAKMIIAELHKDTTDSINYARKIQRAMLPDLAEIKKSLPESFVFYQPKAIVSGDFYWFHKPENKPYKLSGMEINLWPDEDEVFIAAADCTGHGVPGAFMSTLCSIALNTAVEAGISNPAEILSFANNWVKKALKQIKGESGQVVGEVKDGMDIALVKINKRNKTIEYAGANRPLYIAKHETGELEETLEETKANKTAIGGFTPDDYRFTLHTKELSSGDSIYISSDGFADQFGGPKGKKVTTKFFKERLGLIRHMPMDSQQENLENFMNNWMSDVKEQLDDLLVIGVKII